MEIRKAELIDVDRILELLVEVGNIHSLLRPDLFIKDKTKYNKEELEKVILDEYKPIFVYINDDSILCGYAFCVLENVSGNNLVPHKSLYIDDICVSEEFRKEKVGTSLFNYVCEFAKNIGCYNITLNVWEGNESAIKFYKKCGLNVQKTVLETIL